MTKIYAHRGFSAKYIENTMPAFRGALYQGADGIELDVRLSKDGEVVVFHDAKLRRMADWFGHVDQKSAYILKKIPLIQKNQTGHIPLLREYLDWASEQNLVTNIELKSEKENIGLEEKVVEMVREYQMTSRVFFSSFSEISVRKLADLAPDIPVGLLSTDSSEKIIDQAVNLGATLYHPGYKKLTAELVAYAHQRGLKVNVWTVNKKEEMQKMLDFGVDGIITNEVDLAISMKKRGA